MGRSPPSLARRSGPGGPSATAPTARRKTLREQNFASGCLLHSDPSILRATVTTAMDSQMALFLISRPDLSGVDQVKRRSAQPSVSSDAAGGEMTEVPGSRRYMDSPDGHCQVWQGSARCVCVRGKGRALGPHTHTHTCHPCPCQPEREGPREEEIWQRDSERPVQPSSVGHRSGKKRLVAFPLQ